MKILIIQLARLGDIYLNWPSLRSLRRSHPDAEIHVLCRPRFMQAFAGLDCINRIHCLPTTEILEPILVQEGDNTEDSLSNLSHFIKGLRSEDFDRVVNLTYSPASSYIAYQIANGKSQVSGYSRFEDGYLSIPDDTSAYFLAQVGVGMPNRIHLADIFAMALDVDLTPADWEGPSNLPNNPLVGSDYIVIHLGASQVQKQYPLSLWSEVIKTLIESYNGDIVLLGTESEKTLAENIIAEVNHAPNLINWIGATSIQESFSIIRDAELLIGGDSAPVHMASLVSVRVLNISCEQVNFWETGPRTPGSIVVRDLENNFPLPERVAELALMMIHNQPVDRACGKSRELAIAMDGVPSFNCNEVDFSWSLIQALYLGQDFPEPKEVSFFEAMEQLNETNELILEQLAHLKAIGQDSNILNIIARAEEVIEAIVKIVPTVGPIVRWYQTEKLRIGPGDFEQILDQTQSIHMRFGQVLGIYICQDEVQDVSPATDSTEGKVKNEADAI